MPILNTDLRHWRRFVFVLVAITSIANGADRPAGDLVTLRSGSKLRGVLFEQSPQSLTLLVSAKWLSAANAKLHQTARPQTIAANKLGLERAIRRLKSEPLPAEVAVAAFFEQQLEDAQAELAKVETFDPEFLWVTLPMKDVARVEASTAVQRQLLTWAWTEQVDRAENRSEDELIRELKARNVSPTGWPLALIERLPVRDQADEEWVARRALIEYALGPKLDFQGTNDVLARTDKDAPVDAVPLLVEMLSKQLQSQFADLFAEPGVGKGARGDANASKTESLRKAVQTAESEKRTGIRVTRIEFTGDFQQASISTEFIARLGKDSWRPVFQHTERVDAKQARPEAEQRVQNDPRVKQVLDLTRQLGVGADDQVQQAIRFGAATMTAQQVCNSRFAAFRDAYLISLVRPPLSWTR